MARWIFVAGLALATGAACHTSGGVITTDDAGGSQCPCSVPLEAGAALIPCREITCVEGTDYLCPQSGVPSPVGPCIPQGDASFPDACTPTCAKNACEVEDTCGGICRCPTGVLCVGGTCGNGCTGVPGDYCELVATDGAAPTSCCGAGYACQPNEAGVNQCCSITGQGPCGLDTDCCDPGTRCRTIYSDAGVVVGHTCG